MDIIETTEDLQLEPIPKQGSTSKHVHFHKILLQVAHPKVISIVQEEVLFAMEER